MSTTSDTRLSQRELSAWRALISTTTALRTRFESSLQHTSTLSEADYTVLLALTESATDGLRPSDLADAVNWERSRLSHHLGRMERRGLIRRDACLTDSRGFELHLTDEGRAAFRAAAGPHLREVKHLFADALTPQQIESLGEILGALAERLSTESAS